MFRYEKGQLPSEVSEHLAGDVANAVVAYTAVKVRNNSSLPIFLHLKSISGIAAN